ncbi:hypothetical protein QA648_22680 (plasmid) [Rhizobium sp. CB3171]|nr:hypothetical protein [Rhizobium sp. CB3171]WFU05947.1 hypothetical protein QA648_22680 [Rhizobium sp. CB3171]
MTGKAPYARNGASASTLGIRHYDGSTPIANGVNCLIGGTFEVN